VGPAVEVGIGLRQLETDLSPLAGIGKPLQSLLKQDTGRLAAGDQFSRRRLAQHSYPLLGRRWLRERAPEQIGACRWRSAFNRRLRGLSQARQHPRVTRWPDP